ncbi:uncharacterized protein TRAVEDRAFT_20163 [Trametes versicolor FP-101664 SS1]|uniref:uncharacterized protein n=1 Tax=Trametes versicolor (strain FP-101664) TaxID=717944 RepID=UPI00046216F2|nr:uncharacterized protein TRAVEDRAFT_20163 [Trametes versicolor FP-101664 SS1]EIW59897.1 hypothetical protein TRAVEDRAFT_20163 [Trametes versicolor FP-101664 SS1]
MPPRKKQRIDDTVLPVAVVPRRITRASTKAALADGGVAKDSPVIAKTKAKVKSAGEACLSARTIGHEEAFDKARKINRALADTFFGIDAITRYLPVQGYNQERSYDPQCNRILRTHVNRIIRRYKALPAPVTAEALRAFAVQVKADYEARFPVWLNDQEEQRLIRLNDARRQRFEELRSTDWQKELDFMHPWDIKTMSNMPVVRQSSKLTDGGKYPAILYHRCFTGPREGCYNTSTYAVKEYLKEDLYTRTTKTLVHMIYEESLLLCGDKFLSAHIPFKLNDGDGRNPGDVVNRMRRIVSAVGLDPTRATFEDLDRCDVWLRCVTCETEHPKDPIFARLWSSAYEHEVDPTTRDSMGVIQQVSHGTQFPEWRRVDEEDMIKIRAVKDDEYWKTDFDTHCWWSCSLCPNFDERSDEMAIHLEET